MGWKLTVRSGPRVRRATFDDLEQALDDLELRSRELAADVPGAAVDARFRRFEAAERVVARLELAGPERLVPSVRAGIDVRGDGSMEAFEGRVRRRAIAPRRGETPAAALRRVLAGRG